MVNATLRADGHSDDLFGSESGLIPQSSACDDTAEMPVAEGPGVWL